MLDDSAVTNDELTPVSGDGVVTIPDQEEDEMAGEAVDLSPGMQNLLLNETAGNIQADSRRGRDFATLANNSLQAGLTVKSNELGTIESKAHAGLIATDAGGPVNAGRGGA